MTRTIIQTENMSFTYPDGTSALNNINIEIKEGKKWLLSAPMVQVNQHFSLILMVLINPLRV